MVAMRKSMKRRTAPGPRATSERDQPWSARGSVAMLNHLEFSAHLQSGALGPPRTTLVHCRTAARLDQEAWAPTPDMAICLFSGARPQIHPSPYIRAYR